MIDDKNVQIMVENFSHPSQSSVENERSSLLHLPNYDPSCGKPTIGLHVKNLLGLRICGVSHLPEK